MDIFIEKYYLPNLNEEAENLNRPVRADQIEAVIKKLPTNKSPDEMVSQGNSAKHLRKSRPLYFKDY